MWYSGYGSCHYQGEYCSDLSFFHKKEERLMLIEEDLQQEKVMVVVPFVLDVKGRESLVGDQCNFFRDVGGTSFAINDKGGECWKLGGCLENVVSDFLCLLSNLYNFLSHLAVCGNEEAIKNVQQCIQ